jgi:hypothetical protein
MASDGGNLLWTGEGLCKNYQMLPCSSGVYRLEIGVSVQLCGHDLPESARDPRLSIPTTGPALIIVTAHLETSLSQSEAPGGPYHAHQWGDRQVRKL